jgi:hypothetical protein
MMLKMGAVHSSEALANFYQTLWCHIPEESTIHYMWFDRVNFIG